MTELCGDDPGGSSPGGALLHQMKLPPGFAGRPYRHLFNHLVHCYGVVPLGLLRPKPENPAWRLTYVTTNPAWADIVRPEDRVFVLRRGDELMPVNDPEEEELPYGLHANI